MYSDAAKTVGAEFEVAELTALIERALGEAELAPSAPAALRVPMASPS